VGEEGDSLTNKLRKFRKGLNKLGRWEGREEKGRSNGLGEEREKTGDGWDYIIIFPSKRLGKEKKKRILGGETSTKGCNQQHSKKGLSSGKKKKGKKSSGKSRWKSVVGSTDPRKKKKDRGGCVKLVLYKPRGKLLRKRNTLGEKSKEFEKKKKIGKGKGERW